MKRHHEPLADELRAAADRKVPDLIRPGLKIVFCGINPSLYSAWAGHHFARPGNRFWKTLHGAGLTPRLLSPYEDHQLIKRGIGIVNLVDRPTTAAAEVSEEELIKGRAVLEKKIKRYTPEILAVLGVGAYRLGFERPKAGMGLQVETIGKTKIWVLPNPSGLNANYQVDDLIKLFRKLRN